MSNLAPGRVFDMQRLFDKRDNFVKYSTKWNTTQLKIEDLVAEGKCPIISSLRGRLVKAAIANDSDEIINISNIIDEHMKRHHRKRFDRAWLKKG